MEAASKVLEEDSHCWSSLVFPVCEMVENGSCAAISDDDTYGDAEEPAG